MAGGPKLETERDALEPAQRSIEAGAAGVDMGRNIWQAPNAVGMIRAVRAVVHAHASAKEALEFVKAPQATR